MTGLIVQVKLEVEPAFRLRESKVPVHIDYLLGTSLDEERLAQQPDGVSDEKTPLVGAGDDVHFVKQRNEQSMQKIEDIAKSAEHVRMWWYPQTGGVIVARANRTYEVRACTASCDSHTHLTTVFLPCLAAYQGRLSIWQLFPLSRHPILPLPRHFRTEIHFPGRQVGMVAE